MTKNITYSLLSICLLFMASISVLSMQNNDIKIPQIETTLTLDLRHKFNLNLATKEFRPLSFSN
jgi:hypothetical protein